MNGERFGGKPFTNGQKKFLLGLLESLSGASLCVVSAFKLALYATRFFRVVIGPWEVPSLHGFVHGKKRSTWRFPLQKSRVFKVLEFFKKVSLFWSVTC